MSILDRVRLPTPTSSPSQGGGGLLLLPVLAAVCAALASLVVVCLPAVAVWGAASESTGSWRDAAGVGAVGWLLGHGVHLDVGAGSLSLTPGLLAAVPVTVAVCAARRAAASLPTGSGRLRRQVLLAGLTFTASYAGCLLLVVAVTRSGPASASLPSAVVAAGLVPLLSWAVGVVLELRADALDVLPSWLRRWGGAVPVSLRRSLRPACWGVGALLASGAGLVLAMLAVHAGRVAGVQAALETGGVGAAALLLLQLLLLPNAAVWAVSFLAGPGFTLGAGSTVTWSASEPRLLPMVPAFGALPDPGPLPTWLWVSAAVPVGVGVLVGRRSVAAVARLSSWQVKARTAGVSCFVAASGMTVLAWASGGSLGVARLDDVGAPALMLGATLLAELLGGALVAVLWSHHRARRG